MMKLGLVRATTTTPHVVRDGVVDLQVVEVGLLPHPRRDSHFAVSIVLGIVSFSPFFMSELLLPPPLLVWKRAKRRGKKVVQRRLQFNEGLRVQVSGEGSGGDEGKCRGGGSGRSQREKDEEVSRREDVNGQLESSSAEKRKSVDDQ